jgi:hypothetical protein
VQLCQDPFMHDLRAGGCRRNAAEWVLTPAWNIVK